MNPSVYSFIPSPPLSARRAVGRNERGVALVITLIMLSLITFLAVAFLALTRRERASVTVTLEQTDARLALDAALARVQSDIATRLIEGNSFLSYDVLISTNATVAGGLVGPVATNNVSYFDPPGTPSVNNLVPPAAFVQVVSNLLFDPRPPVFVQTNDNPAFPLDFRFYHDLNRNHTNDPTDLRAGVPGDPHWVGLLEHADLPHSRTNRFLGRFCFLALPESKSPDLNYVHNYANPNLPAAMNLRDGFSRNQGLANWEFNLAGFLAELNPRYWQYTNYNPTNLFGPGGNGGTFLLQFDAFLVAKELLAYRYATNVNTLNPLDLFGFPNRSTYPGAGGLFLTDGLDFLADGPLMHNLGSALSGDLNAPPPPPINDNPALPWPGSLNTNRFFSVEELVDTALLARHPNFTLQLSNAMNASPPLPQVNGRDDRNTFYRMISQISMDSAPDPVRRVPAGARDDTGASIIRITLPNHGFDTNEWVRIRGTTNDGTFRIVGVAPNFFDYEQSFFYPNTNAPIFYDNTAAQPTVTIERNPKIHLNFDNFRYAENQFVPWSNKVFFMASADRLLRSYTNMGFGLNVTNIEIFPTNQFNPRVFQILKQVANIADWRENRFNHVEPTNRAPGQPDFPAIYWPRYSANGTNRLWVSDFNIVTFLPPTNTRPVFNPRDASLTNFAVAVNNFYATGLEIPWIVGAEKGYPNFNESIMRMAGLITRKLEVRKTAANQVFPVETNQMYLMQLHPQFTIESWNSYALPTSRDYRITVEGELITVMTNQNGVVVWPPGPGGPLGPPAARVARVQPYNLPPQSIGAGWPGSPGTNSFNVPGFSNLLSMDLSKYILANQVFAPLRGPNTQSNYEHNGSFYLPDWTFVLTNRLRVFVEDTTTTPARLVDAVNIELDTRLNIAQLLQGFQSSIAAGASPTRYWDFRRVGGSGSNAPYQGIVEQIQTSTNWLSPDWEPYFNYATFPTFPNSKFQAASNFATFLTSTNVNSTLSKQAPFNPFSVFVMEIASGVNDPLVHYLPTDFQDQRQTNWVISTGGSSQAITDSRALTNFPSQFAARINRAYEPWGGNHDVFAFDPKAQPRHFDVTRQDPMVRWSDDWLFPIDPVTTNYFGNAGLVGRVHRGTPWQTTYFKGAVHPSNSWVRWAGHKDTHPTNDWALADLFTVSIDPDSRRGLLSINQTNRAAWAAALSGVSVLQNNPPYSSENPIAPILNSGFISPGTTGFDDLWVNLQRARAGQPVGVFSNLASLFSTGALTFGTNTAGISTNSPYIIPNVLVQDRNADATFRSVDASGLDDVAYERIPQQVLSLLKVEEQPRFAVYLWGQSLKPADRSILLNNAFAPNSFGLCTNYQITGEVAAKAIVRVDRRVTPGVPPGYTYQTVIESYQLLPNP